MGQVFIDIYKFFTSAWVLVSLLVVSLASILLALSHPEILPPVILFGGVWYTKLLWFLFGFSILMLFIKRVSLFAENVTKRGFLFAASKAITSIPLAVTLIGLIILLGLIQTFVPQHSFNREVDLIGRFGPENYALMDSLRLFDIFDSWYLFGIVGLFVLNLGACTVKRLQASIKYMKQQMTPKHPDSFERMPESRSFSIAGFAPDAALTKISSVLKSKGFSMRESDGQLMAEKLRWERLSIDIFHIALITTILALAVSGLYGFNTILVAYRGDTLAIPTRDYVVEVEDFDLDTYTDSERVMDWWSKLNVIEDGKVVKQCRIEVNKPCYHQGLGVYQAAMGKDWLGSSVVTFQIYRKDFTDDAPPIHVGEYQIKVGELVEIPEENLRVEMNAFLPDFEIIEGTIFSKSQTTANPAAVLVASSIDGTEPEKDFRTLSLQNAPELQARVEFPYMFIMDGYVAEEFTGLELSSDPGKGIAYASFSLIILTFIGHFLFNHQMLWIAINPEKNKILIGGRARKGDFSDRFEILVDSIEQSLDETGEVTRTGVVT